MAVEMPLRKASAHASRIKTGRAVVHNISDGKAFAASKIPISTSPVSRMPHGGSEKAVDENKDENIGRQTVDQHTRQAVDDKRGQYQHQSVRRICVSRTGKQQAVGQHQQRGKPKGGGGIHHQCNQIDGKQVVVHLGKLSAADRGVQTPCCGKNYGTQGKGGTVAGKRTECRRRGSCQYQDKDNPRNRQYHI